MDIGGGNDLVVDCNYEDKAPLAFTGTVKEVVFDPKPVHQEARIESRSPTQAVIFLGGGMSGAAHVVVPC